MFDKIKEFFLSQYLGGLIRHTLTAIAGYLAAMNIVSEEVALTFFEQLGDWLLPVLAGLLGYASSVAEKLGRY